nr:NAD(P)H-binding protein [Streptomyces sp. 3213.3]
MHCLVTGASGYIGGRLIPELLKAGHRVRCLARSPDRLRDHPWTGDAETVRGDVTDPDSVAAAMHGIDIASYLVHALGSGADFEDTDRRAAHVFAEQARAAGVRRIVHLGGLTPKGVPESSLSPHLRSRAEVGRIFPESPVPATVLRAAVVIGSGSASFEMLRHLTERLPVMVTPSWVHTRTQPIAVRDVLRCLAGSATMPDDINRTFDIGGPDVLTYREMMRRYALVAGLRPRLIVPVPILTPWLSSHWVGLITPVPASLARPLTESLRHEVICHEHDIARHLPDQPSRPLPFDQALALALQRIREAQVVTRWSSASVPGAPSDPLPTDPDWAGGSLWVVTDPTLLHCLIGAASTAGLLIRINDYRPNGGVQEQIAVVTTRNGEGVSAFGGRISRADMAIRWPELDRGLYREVSTGTYVSVVAPEYDPADARLWVMLDLLTGRRQNDPAGPCTASCRPPPSASR